MLDSGEWMPTTRHLNLARLMASGDYNLTEASRIAGVPFKTAARWNLDPRFRELVRSFWREAWDRIEGKAVMTGPAALAVIAAVVAGERPADDAYEAAIWLVARLLTRLDREAAGQAHPQTTGIEVSQSVRITGDIARELIDALTHDHATAGIEYRVIPSELVAGDAASDSPSD